MIGVVLVCRLLISIRTSQAAFHCALHHDSGHAPGMCMQSKKAELFTCTGVNTCDYVPLLIPTSARLAEPVPMFADPDPEKMHDELSSLSVFDEALYQHYRTLFTEVLIPQIAWSIKTGTGAEPTTHDFDKAANLVQGFIVPERFGLGIGVLRSVAQVGIHEAKCPKR